MGLVGASFHKLGVTWELNSKSSHIVEHIQLLKATGLSALVRP